MPLLMPTANRYRVGAVAKLDKFPGKLLYVARGVSPTVIRHLQLTAQNVDEFNRLRKARGGLKIAHGLMYLMISMTALLAAIWVGLWFAGRFVAPIRRLIAAAQEVSTGNLMIALPEKRGEGDLRRLSKTFNTMTRELKHQRDALVTANEQLIERRHFMEAVLSGVSAGVIGLDSQDRITLVSRAAASLLGLSENELVGKKLKDAIPLFGAVLQKKDEHTLKGRSLEEVTFTVGGEERTFAVMVTRERASGGDVGSVVTFDDVTDLVVAQRTAAWADVARRIAHEIKNPLTPIQLAAERLRKKYAASITKDRETFDRLTMTIERQVGDLKAMVDEFAEFARMPKPEMARHDLRHAVQEPVVLFREGHPEIQYELKLPEKPILMSFDIRLMTRAVTNLVKNASEAVEAAKELQGQGQRLEGSHRDHRHAAKRSRHHRGDRQRRRPAQTQPQPPARAVRHHQGPQRHRARPRHGAEDHRAARRHACAGGRTRSARAHARRTRAHNAAIGDTPAAACTPNHLSLQSNICRPTRPERNRSKE